MSGSRLFLAGRCIMFPCISREGPFFTSCAGKKDHIFGKKYQIIQERLCAGAAPFGETIFSGGPKKISYFHVFFKKDHLSFSVQGVKRNIIFLENTRKIIFQLDPFENTIFSGRLGKENMAFRAVLERITMEMKLHCFLW